MTWGVEAEVPAVLFSPVPGSRTNTGDRRRRRRNCRRLQSGVGHLASHRLPQRNRQQGSKARCPSPVPERQLEAGASCRSPMCACHHRCQQPGHTLRYPLACMRCRRATEFSVEPRQWHIGIVSPNTRYVLKGDIFPQRSSRNRRSRIRSSCASSEDGAHSVISRSSLDQRSIDSPWIAYGAGRERGPHARAVRSRDSTARPRSPSHTLEPPSSRPSFLSQPPKASKTGRASPGTSFGSCSARSAKPFLECRFRTAPVGARLVPVAQVACCCHRWSRRRPRIREKRKRAAKRRSR